MIIIFHGYTFNADQITVITKVKPLKHQTDEHAFFICFSDGRQLQVGHDDIEHVTALRKKLMDCLCELGQVEDFDTVKTS